MGGCFDTHSIDLQRTQSYAFKGTKINEKHAHMEQFGLYFFTAAHIAQVASAIAIQIGWATWAALTAINRPKAQHIKCTQNKTQHNLLVTLQYFLLVYTDTEL